MLCALQSGLVIKVISCVNGASGLRQGGHFKPYTSFLGFKYPGQCNMCATLRVQEESDTVIFSVCLKNFEEIKFECDQKIWRISVKTYKFSELELICSEAKFYCCCSSGENY